MNQIKAGVVLNYVIIGLNTLLGLLYTPYMLRMLGQNEYGLYSLVSSVIAYLTILDFGFGDAIIRYTSKFRVENNSDKQWEMFGMFMIIYIVIGFLAMIAGLVLYYKTDVLFDKTMSTEDLYQAKKMIMLLVVNMALTFPLSIFGSIITAYENFVFQKVVSIIRIILMTAVLVALLYWGYKALAMVIVQTIFNLGVLFINFFYCKFKLHIKIWFKGFDWFLLKEIAVYSFWIFLNAIMDRIYWGTGQFVLGSLSGTIAVAIFSVAITLQQMYMTMSTSINSVLLPKITTMVATQHSNHSIADLFIRTGRLQYLILGLVLSGFIVFGKQFIVLWAGTDYIQSFCITLIFFIALLVPLIQNTGITILKARNQMRFRCLLYLGIAIVSLVFQIFLSKSWGALGCAIAIGAALIIGQGLIMNIYYEYKQHLEIKRFWKEIGSQSFVPICFSLTGVILFQKLNMDNWFCLLGCMTFYLILYLPCSYLFSMNNYEKKICRELFTKIIP